MKSARLKGGGFNLSYGNNGYYAGGANIGATTATLTNNTLAGNTASDYGGGALIGATTATLTNNNITGNIASWGDGGGASIFAYNTATLSNNNITGNAAGGSGGGVEISEPTPTTILTNNTLAGNTASGGGGLFLSLTTDSAKLYNNLFWDNVATANQGADLWIFNDSDGDYLPTPVTLLANNFDQAQPTGFSSTLLITIDPSNLNKLDPLFVDASTDDFHLQPDSPMIDAGYPATPNLPDFDIEGTPRVLGNSVDIGAYEFDDGSEAVLYVTLAGTGSGTVTSSPTGVNCGNDCSEYYPRDTSVTLTATPADANSAFTGWSGDANCVDGQVTMTTHISCTATFMAQRRLTVTRTGSGLITSTPTGIDCGSACAAHFYQAEPVTLTATAGAGYQFASWTGCDSVSGNSCTVAMTGAKAVKATFTLLPKYTLAVTKSGTGTVASTPAGINCGYTCSAAFASGTPVTLTATAGAGYQFASWTGCDSVSGNSCMAAMTGAKAVKATFTLLPKYTLAVTKSGTGTVASTPAGINCGFTCSAAFYSGTSVTLTATAGSGYVFSTWTGCDSVSGNSCTVAMTGAKAVKADFIPAYTLSLAKSAYSYGTVTSAPGGIVCGTTCSTRSALFASGATVTLTATPITGRRFKNWSGACTGVVATSCEVPMTKAQSVTAVFQ